MFDILGSDIVVMQELKIQRKDLRDDMVLLDGWDCYFSLPKHKKGYSGVGIYTRNATCAPVKAEEGLLGVLPSPSGVPYGELPDEQAIGGYPSALQVAELGLDPAALDAEGRCVVLEFPAFILFGVYSPANSNGLRDDFRHGFVCALECRIRNLVRDGKRVVLVGDLNVSRDETETASAADDMRKSGITHEEYISTPNRRIFNQLLIGGEVAGERDEGREEGILWDTTRAFHPDRKGMYTHWEQKINARPGNFGSRIDYVLVCGDMKSWVKGANIQEGLLGSDHCPVYADFHDTITIRGEEGPMLDHMSPLGVFRGGSRKRDWNLLDAPAYSAKRMPEFDKRRTIKSMFAAPGLKKSQSSHQEKPATNTLASADPSIAPDILTQSTAPEISEARRTAAPPPPRRTVSPLKRKSSAAATDKGTKRQKPDAAPAKLKGQQSLKGFFQKGKIEKGVSLDASPHEQNEPPVSNRPSTPAKSAQSPAQIPAAAQDSSQVNGTPSVRSGDDDRAASIASNTASPASAMSIDISPSKFSAHIAAVEQNQKTWGKLFSRPVAPLCEGHDEPCKSMLTKKKGSNQGRSFWMCARPLGPSGSKEKGTQWRCPTFIWCSDWTGKREGQSTTGD